MTFPDSYSYRINLIRILQCQGEGSRSAPIWMQLWTGLIGVGVSIGMCLKVAPNKIIHRIKVGAAGRPLLLGDEVVALLLEPGHRPVGRVAGGRA